VSGEEVVWAEGVHGRGAKAVRWRDRVVVPTRPSGGLGFLSVEDGTKSLQTRDYPPHFVEWVHLYATTDGVVGILYTAMPLTASVVSVDAKGWSTFWALAETSVETYAGAVRTADDVVIALERDQTVFLSRRRGRDDIVDEVVVPMARTGRGLRQVGDDFVRASPDGSGRSVVRP
jgi:hypothetical protein